MSDISQQLPPNPPSGDKRQVSSKVLRGALAVSVALNLAIAGIVVGAVFHKDGVRGPASMTRDLGFGPFTEALSVQDRRALRDWLQQRAPELRAANQQRRADLVALQSALRADPFVPQDLTRALDTMRLRLEGQLNLGHQALGEVIVAMPEGERWALADRLERGLRRGGEQRGQDNRKSE